MASPDSTPCALPPFPPPHRSTFEDCWAFVQFVSSKYKDREVEHTGEVPVAQLEAVEAASE